MTKYIFNISLTKIPNDVINQTDAILTWRKWKDGLIKQLMIHSFWVFAKIDISHYEAMNFLYVVWLTAVTTNATSQITFIETQSHF